MRNLIKRIIYKVLGESFYQKAYVRGKISDIRNGQNLEPEFHQIGKFIDSNSNVLDIGANYGHYSVELAKICVNGVVYAFEPVPFTFGVIEKVVNYFKLKNVRLYNFALSNENGDAKMIIPRLDFGAPNTGIAHLTVSKSNLENSVDVKLRKGDELLPDCKIDFIKIDIEGFEPFAFEGLKQNLIKSKPVILIEFSHGCLRRAGFSTIEFAKIIRTDYNMEFYKLVGNHFVSVQEENPHDGYYFLIPFEKISTFNFLNR